MAEGEALDLGRLGFVARNYSELGALRLVPVGLFALLAAPLAGGWSVLPARWEAAVVLGALGAAVAGFWAVALWYKNNYGMTLEAWPHSPAEARRWASAWAGAAAMVAVVVTDFGGVVFFLGYVAGAAVMVRMALYWRREGRMWPQAYALTALLATGGFLHWAPPWAAGGGYAAWVLALLGATLVAVGIKEHRDLAAAAQPLVEEDYDG
jgi:hypothetical protein